MTEAIDDQSGPGGDIYISTPEGPRIIGNENSPLIDLVVRAGLLEPALKNLGKPSTQKNENVIQETKD